MIKEYKPGDVVITKYDVEFSIVDGPFNAHGIKAYNTFQLHTIFESDIKKKIGILLMDGTVFYKDNDGSDTKRNSKKRHKR
jgi:hypothetical protein